MTVALKSFLRSDETVVYESRFHLRDLVWSFCKLALVMAAVSWFATLIFPFARNADRHLLFVIFMPLLIVFWVRHSAALVTDRRVLASSKKSRSDLIEVPLDEISAVARVFMGVGYHTGYVSVRTRSGGALGLPSGTNPEELCRQLAASAGVSADGTINMKVILISNLTVLASFVTAFSLIGLIETWLWETHGAVAALVYLVPVILGGIFVGFYLGPVPVLLLVRLILSPVEAKRLMCVGIDPYSPSRMNRMNRASSRPYGWILGRLYGCKISCD